MPTNLRFAHRQMRRVPPGWRHPYYRDPAGYDCFLPIARSAMPAVSANGDCKYQMYETQTQGTPISPAFSSRGDLIRWLAKNKIAYIGPCPGTEEDWNKVVENSDPVDP
jgi:hypothetical protein